MQEFRTAPAFFRRAFFIVTCFASAVGASSAQKGPSAPPLTQLGALNPAEGRAALEQVRQQGIAGSYYLEFQLRVMPRRGPERLISGRLWGSRSPNGALTRVSLNLPAHAAAPVERRFLIQSGPVSSAWRWDTGGTVQVLGTPSPFDPVVEDTQVTAFDLQMPFIFWENFSYHGLTRFLGRPAHVLILRPPADYAAKYPGLTGVRVFLDTQFNVLVKTEILGARDRVLKTMSLSDLKKVGEQWIPKTFDFRDDVTRNKTRFDATAAGLNLEFPRSLFEPAQLGEAFPPPADLDVVKLGS